jgi:hypothetical protein
MAVAENRGNAKMTRRMSNDNLPPERNRPRLAPGCLRLMLLAGGSAVLFVVLLVLLIDFTNTGEKVKKGLAEAVASGLEPAQAPVAEPQVIERVVEKVVEVPKIVEVEKKEPLPSRYVDRRAIDTVELWNGLSVSSEVKTQEGGHATAELAKDESFQLAISMNLTIPRANQSLEELAKLNPELPKILPDLARLVETAQVSPFYHALYEAKSKRLQQNLTRLDRILSRHNFYDCETVLELTHPDTGQRALMIQSEMDVVSDGSDGDRWPELDDYISMSDNYRYSTSYAWPKKTATPNPMLARREAELTAKQARFAQSGLSIEENRELRTAIDQLTIEVGEMKARSFLIAEADPFVVIPLTMLGRTEETPFGPKIGDYVVVIFGGRVFPAIAGDAGPTFQAGEASLRLAKALNEKAGVYNRPVSDLKVTYLVFPGSADPVKDAPDLVKWRETCERLLGGLGGLGEGYQLHEWEDLIAKKKAEAQGDVPAVSPPAAPVATPPPAVESPALPRPATTPGEAVPSAPGN